MEPKRLNLPIAFGALEFLAPPSELCMKNAACSPGEKFIYSKRDERNNLIVLDCWRNLSWLFDCTHLQSLSERISTFDCGQSQKPSLNVTYKCTHIPIHRRVFAFTNLDSSSALTSPLKSMGVASFCLNNLYTGKSSLLMLNRSLNWSFSFSPYSAGQEK